MKKDNLLADYLNNAKENSLPEEDIAQMSEKTWPELLTLNLTSFLLLVTRSVVFGYSLKILFGTNWAFIETICIGLGIVFIFSYLTNILSIFKK
jgi:hypothetical protein